MTVFVEATLEAAEELRAHIDASALAVGGMASLAQHLEQNPGEDVCVIGPSVDPGTALALAEEMRVARPSFGVVLIRTEVDATLLTDALR
ncbi:MAG: pilus assembly protein CpaE, partial [Frankiaceae bacterium]|nr:pilus assembly protein CpaE [Frankiaceae bacterium]